MIQKSVFILFTMLLLILLFGCNKKDNSLTIPVLQEEAIVSEVVIDSIITEKIIDTILTDSIKDVLKKTASFEKKKELKNDKKQITIVDYPIYNNLKTLLSHFKIGEKQTKEELIAAHLVPEEALKIIKSVTKTAENELAIEWKSTWLIEKVSDVKFQNGTIKVAFKDDLIYTSGNAIGIKHDGKVYTDLKIKKNKAYIPSVKGYSWRIGK